VREKHCWLAENKWLKAQANRLFIVNDHGMKSHDIGAGGDEFVVYVAPDVFSLFHMCF
jgi:hypothetical protein